MKGDLNESTTESAVSPAPWLKKKCRYISVPQFDMAITKWFGQLQPVQLYVILALTIAFFIIELIVSHVTHALTLLMDSYHMLCNIMALVGCIITMKYGSLSDSQSNLRKSASQSKGSSVGEELTSNPTPCSDKKRAKISLTQETQLRKLKNTFGWARIDVISMLMCCVFLASFSFSIFVEALQTLVHIDHQDEMHYPVSVFCIGTVGLLLNGVCYLVIGGYTFHQGSFLYITESGDVVLSKVVVNQSVQHGERRLSRTKYIHTTKVQKQRQGLWEMMRDVNGCIIVIICAALIYFTNKNTAKYIDPLLSLVSATLIMVLSYPYVKESCLILLQTIPDTINIDVLKAELLNHFPDIINVHDFHIWQLTGSKIYSTVHIIFESPKVYGKIKEDVKDFFNENGISHVTIQPEFYNKDVSMESLMNKVSADCLVSCQEEGCKKSHCCPEYKTEKSIFGSKDGLIANPKSKNVEVIQFNDLANDPKNLDEKIQNEINLAKSELIEPAKQEVPTNSSINVESVKEKLNEENLTETNAETELVVSEELCTEKEEARDVNVRSMIQTKTDICNQENEMLSQIRETVTTSIDDCENLSQKNNVQNDLQVDSTL